MHRHPPTLDPRNLGALLDETFAIYGRHSWRFVGLVAIVQVPIRIISVVLDQLFGGGPAALMADFLLKVIGTIIVFGPAVFAVGQQYITGGITIGTCYTRAWWKVMSMVVLTLVVLVMSSPLVPPALTDQGMVMTLAVLMVFPAVALLIYWSMAVQAVIVEGVNAVGALRRSFALVRGSWWRIFGTIIVLGLVALGLAIVLGSLFALLPAAFGSDQTSGLSVVSRFLGGVVVVSAVQPVIFIGLTLLYYDLRVRKEKYDLATMSSEMGIAAV